MSNRHNSERKRKALGQVHCPEHLTNRHPNRWSKPSMPYSAYTPDFALCIRRVSCWKEQNTHAERFRPVSEPRGPFPERAGARDDSILLCRHTNHPGRGCYGESARNSLEVSPCRRVRNRYRGPLLQRISHEDDRRIQGIALALAASKPGIPQPTPLDKFLSTRPIAKTFLKTPKLPPVSYATLPFFGVNSFKFTNARSGVTFGRYQIRPSAGEQYLLAEQLSKVDADYLLHEIAKRVHRGPVEFKLSIQVAGEGDKIDDPSITWPDTLEACRIGHGSHHRGRGGQSRCEQQASFSARDCGSRHLPADPMIPSRSAACPVDFDRRTKG